ncbi:MAG TPA: hypothetical protein VFY49_15570 [Myxococcota bacterium]|nr:hypothetical protein [Myxococcota bacterium]
MPSYTYSLQYGDSEISTVDERGNATAREILAAFDAFDWPGQIAKANSTQKCSPTFTVDEVGTGRTFWVSGYGTPETFQFVSFYAYPVRKKAWFGLVERDGFAGPNARQDLSPSEAREAVRLFLDGRHDELIRLVSAA